jgi:WD40 repeat protein
VIDGVFSPDGRRLMASSRDETQTVRIWDIASPRQIAAWEAEEPAAEEGAR